MAGRCCCVTRLKEPRRRRACERSDELLAGPPRRGDAGRDVGELGGGYIDPEGSDRSVGLDCGDGGCRSRHMMLVDVPVARLPHRRAMVRVAARVNPRVPVPRSPDRTKGSQARRGDAALPRPSGRKMTWLLSAMRLRRLIRCAPPGSFWRYAMGCKRPTRSLGG